MKLLTFFLLLTSVVFAHGGIYVGPAGGGTPGYNGPIGGGSVGPQPGGTTPNPIPGGTTPPPVAGGTTPPTPFRPTPGASTPSGGRGFGGATSKGRSKSNETIGDWTWWWGINDDEFLSIRAKALNETDTDNKDTFLGGGGDLHGTQSVTLRHIRKSIMPSLLKGLSDPYYDARAAAAVALGKVGADSESVSRLGSLLKDSDHRVREAACIGLGLTKNVEAIRFLKEVIGEKGVNAKLKFFASIAYLQIVSVNEAENSGFISYIIESARSKEANVDSNLGVVIGLSLVHDELSKVFLESLVKDEEADQMIRAYAAISLGKRKSYSSLPIVYSLLNDKSSLVSSSSIIALGHLVKQEDTERVQALIRTSNSHPDRGVRNFAMISLGRVGGGKAQACLMTHIIKGQYDDVTFSAIGIALTKDSKEDIGRLLVAAYDNHKDQKVKSARAIAIGILGHKPFGERLIKDLEDERNQSLLRGYLCISAGMLGLTDAEQGMMNILKQRGDLDARSRAAIGLGLINSTDAIPQIVELMKESTSNKSNLASLTLSLGYIGDTKAIDPLVSNSENTSEIQRAFAYVSLGILGDKCLVPYLFLVQKDSNYLLQTQGVAELLTIL